MAGNKAIYAIAVAVFAGLALVSATNYMQNDASIDSIDNEAFAQSVIGIRQNVITVTGSAFKDVEPDQVVISFGLETQALTADQATALNAETMNKVVDAVKATGITEKEISTSRFNVFPNYDSTGRIITGYTTSNIISVKTKMLDKTSQIIDASVEAGANRVENVYFTLSDEMQKQLRDQLIGDAIKDAQNRAAKALQPLNKQIIGVKSVSLSDFGIPGPIPVFERMMMKEGIPSTPIFTTEQQVSMSATVIFLID
jgi:hypothetical protein